MASLESTWNLSCNSSTPRSIAVYTAPTAPIPSLASSSKRSTGGVAAGAPSNPFESKTSGGPKKVLGLSSAASSTNPFENAVSSSSNPSTNTYGGDNSYESNYNTRGGSGDRYNHSHSNNPHDGFHHPPITAEYAVMIGTERGTLHYRTFPSKKSMTSSNSNTTSSSTAASTNATTMGRNFYNLNRSSAIMDPLGILPGSGGGRQQQQQQQHNSHNQSSSQHQRMMKNSIGGGYINNNAGGGGVHTIHQPIDDPIGGGGDYLTSVVACVRAAYDPIPPSITHHGSTTSASSSASSLSVPSIFLFLKEDTSFNNASPNKTSNTSSTTSNTPMKLSSKYQNNGGAYNASLMILDHTNQAMLPLHQLKPNNKNNTSVSSSLSFPMPKMSCVTFHPNCGFVYASGTSVHSLPPSTVQLLTDSLQQQYSIPSSSSSSMYYPSIYYEANHILPSSLGGVRTGTPKSTTANASTLNSTLTTATMTSTTHSPDASLTAVCNGYVMVVAVGGGFYGVSGKTCSISFWKQKCEEEELMQEADGDGSGGGDNGGDTLMKKKKEKKDEIRRSSVGGVTLKGRKRANNSSVATGNRQTTTNPQSNKNNGGHELQKVLKFAQSSQVHPAIVVEIPSFTEPTNKKTTRNSSTTSIHNTTSRVEDDGSISSLVFLGSGKECAVVEIVYSGSTNSQQTQTQQQQQQANQRSCISVSPPRHGIATLASPILAAAGLIPSSLSTSPKSKSGKKSQLSSSKSSSSQQPLIAILTSDGLVHTCSPCCISVPLSTIEVGSPNDFFTLRPLPNNHVFAGSYSGEGRLLHIRSDTIQDMADRVMKLAIDAFGTSGFPRSELAEAVGASFSATSYVGPEPTGKARNMLRQYLETVLGLDTSGDYVGSCGDMSRWLLEDEEEDEEEEKDGGVGMRTSMDSHEDLDEMGEDHHHHDVGSTVPATFMRRRRPLGSTSTATFLSGSALLCLVCTHIVPTNASLANRAAKSCATKMGVVGNYQQSGMGPSAVKVCELVADRLLHEAAATNGTLLKNVASPNPIQSSYKSTHKGGIQMEMVEAAVWLLRSCGQHERAIEVLQERMGNPSVRNKGVGGGDGESDTMPPPPPPMSSPDMPKSSTKRSGGWSQIKYETHTAAHLGELWSCGDEACCHLVLNSAATQKLLETNSVLGLSIFTTPHPQNEQQWMNMDPRDDPLGTSVFPMKVVDLLKSIRPMVAYDSTRMRESSRSSVASDLSEDQEHVKNGTSNLPLGSGRALAITYLESSIGISSGRPISIRGDSRSSLLTDDRVDERIAELHDELAYLLLEGVISECSDDETKQSSDLGELYRGKLRRLLAWPNSKIRSERLMSSLPSSFLRERALLLGRLGRHEDALRILYLELNSLELALEYCDARYERQQKETKKNSAVDFKEDLSGQGSMRTGGDAGCAYLPLVSVALKSDKDPERGIAAAIQVLSLRKEAIDRAAALRLLPQSVPMSAIARPFLIPALIDTESQKRRLTIVSSLLRAKYVSLKQSLTEAQIKSQSMLHGVPALRSLNLGDPIYTSKPFKARPSNSHIAAAHFPDVTIYKHFFPRYVIIQAKVSNTTHALDGKTLGEVSLVVAESSDEALLPSTNVPIKTLPPKATGSSWYVLAASPHRLDGTAILACEMRYTVLAIDSVTGAPLSFSKGFAAVGSGRPFVEEVQDIEIRPAEFSG